MNEHVPLAWNFPSLTVQGTIALGKIAMFSLLAASSNESFLLLIFDSVIFWLDAHQEANHCFQVIVISLKFKSNGESCFALFSWQYKVKDIWRLAAAGNYTCKAIRETVGGETSGTWWSWRSPGADEHDQLSTRAQQGRKEWEKEWWEEE